VCWLLDTSRSANEAWVSRQALQDVYQKLLVMDLEFALDKKVEQELYVQYFTLFCPLTDSNGNNRQCNSTLVASILK